MWVGAGLAQEYAQVGALPACVGVRAGLLACLLGTHPLPEYGRDAASPQVGGGVGYPRGRPLPGCHPDRSVMRVPNPMRRHRGDLSLARGCEHAGRCSCFHHRSTP